MQNKQKRRPIFDSSDSDFAPQPNRAVYRAMGVPFPSDSEEAEEEPSSSSESESSDETSSSSDDDAPPAKRQCIPGGGKPDPANMIGKNTKVVQDALAPDKQVPAGRTGMMATGMNRWFSANDYINPLLFDGLTFDADGVPELEEFDILEDIPPDGTVVGFGKRRTGKSFMARWILYLLRDRFPRGVVFSETDRLNKFYRTFMPRQFIVPAMDNELLTQLIEQQAEIIMYPGHKDRKAVNDDYARLAIIFDDVISEESLIRYSKPLGKLFVEGRHSECFSYLNTQYFKAIPPRMRTNIDVGIQFAATEKNIRDGMFELFGQGFQSKKLYLATLDKYTQDNMALIALFTDNSDPRIKHRFKWCKAKEPPPFEFGYHLFHNGESTDEEVEVNVDFGKNDVM